ncbi:MAG: hypothetical protein V5A74_01625 [Desulfohalobiaceae bacterium]
MSNSNKQKDVTPEELEKRLDEIFGGGQEESQSTEEQTLLGNLESAVLTMDWELSDETVKTFLSELSSLKAPLSEDRLQANFLKILQSLGKYIQKRKAKAEPETINLLQTVFADFKKVVESEELTRKQKKEILVKNIEQYNALKSKIAEGKRVKVADSRADDARPATASQESSKDAAASKDQEKTQSTEYSEVEETPEALETPDDTDVTEKLTAYSEQSGAAGNKTVLEAVEELKEVVREEFRRLRQDLGVQDPKK